MGLTGEVGAATASVASPADTTLYTTATKALSLLPTNIAYDCAAADNETRC